MSDMSGQEGSRQAATDAELLSSGRGEDFGILYDRHAAAVLAFLYRRTADSDTAADLAAETFAQAFLSRGRYRETGSGARAWLFGIAHHQLSRTLRRRRVEDRARRRLGMERVPMDEVSYERIEELADFSPIREAIREAMGFLSPKLAEAVTLRIGLELPYDEVARRLNCSPGAARVRVARGLAHLTDLLEVQS
jgi:RNA polymerase sigma factor (sigma-70 family)